MARMAVVVKLAGKIHTSNNYRFSIKQRFTTSSIHQGLDEQQYGGMISTTTTCHHGEGGRRWSQFAGKSEKPTITHANKMLTAENKRNSIEHGCTWLLEVI